MKDNSEQRPVGENVLRQGNERQFGAAAGGKFLTTGNERQFEAVASGKCLTTGQ